MSVKTNFMYFGSKELLYPVEVLKVSIYIDIMQYYKYRYKYQYRKYQYYNV